MYHKVDIITPSRWWVSVGAFEKQMLFLKKNYEFVYLDQYDLESNNQVVITFDDGYENIFNHAFPVLQKNKIPFEVFVNGDLIGGWNDFDKEELMTRLCCLEHLEKMSKGGGRMQWHTRGHRLLPKLTDEQLEFQVSITPELRSQFPEPHFNWFAYPYGMHDQRCVDFIRSRFSGALSVDAGTDKDIFQLNREMVDEYWIRD